MVHPQQQCSLHDSGRLGSQHVLALHAARNRPSGTWNVASGAHQLLKVMALLLLAALCPQLTASSARPVFQHWLQLVERHHVALAPGIPHQAKAMRAGVPVLPAACLYLYTYNATDKRIDFWPRAAHHACRMLTALERCVACSACLHGTFPACLYGEIFLEQWPQGARPCKQLCSA